MIITAVVISLSLLAPPPTRTLEDSLRTELAHTRLGSAAFHRTLRAELRRFKAKSVWWDDFGPSTVLVATIHYPGPEVEGEKYASYAFWPAKKGTRVQVLDGFNMGDLNRGDKGGPVIMEGENYRSGDRLVRCGWASCGGNWDWPDARVYRLKGDRWVMTSEPQPPDEIEAYPGTHFLRRHGRLDPNVVVASTEVHPDHISQPHAGPLLWYEENWTIAGNEINRGVERQVPSPVGELDRLAGLAQSGKHAAFDSAVPKASRQKLWKLLQRHITVTCDGDYNFNACDKLRLWEDGVHGPGNVDELVMHFVKRHRGWRLLRVTD